MATIFVPQECIIHQSIQISSTKYFCYFDIKEHNIEILVTDISHSWHSNVYPRDVFKMLKIDSLQKFQEFIKRELQVSTKVTIEKFKLELQIGTKPQLKLELTEVTDEDNTNRLYQLLTNVSEQCHKFEKRCETLQLKVTTLENDFKKSDKNFVPLPERKKGRAPKIKRPEGASLINPSSKRKKVAKGVDFEGDTSD